MFRHLRAARLFIPLAFLVCLGVPFAIAALSSFAWDALFGQGSVTMIGPAEREIQFAFDGQPAQVLPSQYRFSFPVDQGEHTLQTPGGRRVFRISSGLTDLLVPVDESQCFILLEKDDATRPLLRVKGGEIIDVPSSKKPVDVPCAELALSDEELAGKYR